MKRGLIGGLIFAFTAVAAVAPAQWTVDTWVQGGPDGHWYSVRQITGGTTGWLIARSQAQALVAPNGASADLTSITSSAENAFIFAGINSAQYWTIDAAGNNEGPNIGAFQTNQLSEPAGNWAWASGETFSFTAWAPGEPNNSSGVENFGTFFTQGSGRSAQWNDISSGTGTVGAQGVISYYVAEAVPEPASLALLAGGFALLKLRRRMK